MRHRMRDFGERQLPKGFCRANPLKLCEFADRMLGTEKTSAKENFMRRVLLPTMVFCFFASGHFVSAAPQAEQKMEELSHPKTLEELQKAMKEVVEKNHVTGAGVALVSNGQLLWCGGLGKADLAANRDIACDTEFRVGSISKTFVALALLKLEEEGRINLYARLQDVAPEIPMKNRWGNTNPVRIVNLLEHSAGFDDMEFAEVYNRHDRADYPLLDVFKRFQEPENVRWPAGTRFAYSNPGYGIAGHVIEKVTGQPFDAYIQQRILAPLEITVGDFRFTDANRAALAQGYQGNPPRAVAYKNIYLRPAGDMKASPGELAKLVQFFLRRGKRAQGIFRLLRAARHEEPVVRVHGAIDGRHIYSRGRWQAGMLSAFRKGPRNAVARRQKSFSRRKGARGHRGFFSRRQRKDDLCPLR